MSVAAVLITVVVCFVLVCLVGLSKRIQTTYTITNRHLTIDRRLTIDAGLFSRELHETRLALVQNVGTKQAFLNRILRVGTVDFDTAPKPALLRVPRRVQPARDRALGRSGDPRAPAEPQS